MPRRWSASNFNPRTREGVRPRDTSCAVSPAMFQSTHPRGVRPAASTPRRRSTPVSIHAPARGATRRGRGCNGGDSVSIHAPARGATAALPYLARHRIVSIHAPARGATLLERVARHHRLVSIHAPARGATGARWHTTPTSSSFNPRTREGCDQARPGSPRRPTSFNPRTREGCDYCTATRFMYWSMFQSTHPRGVRRPPARRPRPPIGFNPRTREGCDRRRFRRFWPTTSFNPRTREGCDPKAVASSRVGGAFQSTHPRGVRRWRQVHLAHRHSFNPRTREGCDWL